MLGEPLEVLWAAVSLFLMRGPNVIVMTVVAEGVGVWAPMARISHDSSV